MFYYQVWGVNRNGIPWHFDEYFLIMHSFLKFGVYCNKLNVDQRRRCNNKWWPINNKTKIGYYILKCCHFFSNLANVWTPPHIKGQVDDSGKSSAKLGQDNFLACAKEKLHTSTNAKNCFCSNWTLFFVCKNIFCMVSEHNFHLCNDDVDMLDHKFHSFNNNGLHPLCLYVVLPK